MENLTLSASDVVTTWFDNHVPDDKTKYSSDSRRELLDILAHLMKQHNIDYDDAKSHSIRQRIIKTLTTKQGRKNKDNYEGWTDAVAQDYTSSLIRYYAPDIHNLDENIKPIEIDNLQELVTQVQNNPEFMLDDNKLINDWIMKKFGFITPELRKEIYTIGTTFNMLMQYELGL